MTDADGDIVQHYGYQPYGSEREGISNSNAFPVSSRYTGQTLDTETGLYYYGARYYDPEIARFIQADTVVPDPGSSQAYNRYAYVYNNPLKFSDPTGHFPWAVAAAMMKAMSYFNAVKSVCIAVHTGDFRGLALGLISSFIGGQIGGALGGAIQGATDGIGAALGGAIGAAALNVAVSGGNAARAIGEAVIWAYIGHYCKTRAEANGSSKEKSVGEQHAQDEQKSEGNVGTSTPLITASVYRADLGLLNARPDAAPSVTWPGLVDWVEQVDWAEVGEKLHTALDIAGAIEIPGTPLGIGWVFDSMNAALYLAEGKPGAAAAAVLCVVGGDIAIKGAKYGLKSLKAVRGLKGGAGIYQFTAASGKQYVGQSRWITARLKAHQWLGRLPRGQEALIWEMPGSTRLERRIMEQTRINELGGVDALDNAINAIRESDWSRHGIKPPH